jgi:hypothetical protein
MSSSTTLAVFFGTAVMVAVWGNADFDNEI